MPGAQKQLLELTKKTFQPFFETKKLHVHAVSYSEAPASKVTKAWIQFKMKNTGTKTRDIALDTGLNASELIIFIRGEKPLSPAMKALFWFYFTFKEK